MNKEFKVTLTDAEIDELKNGKTLSIIIHTEKGDYLITVDKFVGEQHD